MMSKDHAHAFPRMPRGEDQDPDGVLGPICSALRGLRYGRVTVVVQDGVVIQVERTEKIRVGKD